MYSNSEFAALMGTYKELRTKGELSEDQSNLLVGKLVDKQASGKEASPLSDDFDDASMWDLRNLARNKTLRSQLPWADRYVHLARENERIRGAHLDGGHVEKKKRRRSRLAGPGMASSRQSIVSFCSAFSFRRNGNWGRGNLWRWC